MAETLERKAISTSFELSRPQQTIEETKTIELTSLEQTQITLTPEEKRELQILKKIVEEIQMWQEETIEIIRLVDKTPKTIEESETLVHKVNEISQTVEAQSRRLEDASRFTKDETYTKTVQETMTKQQQVQQLVKELHERVSSVLDKSLLKYWTFRPLLSILSSRSRKKSALVSVLHKSCPSLQMLKSRRDADTNSRHKLTENPNRKSLGSKMESMWRATWTTGKNMWTEWPLWWLKRVSLRTQQSTLLRRQM